MNNEKVTNKMAVERCDSLIEKVKLIYFKGQENEFFKLFPRFDYHKINKKLEIIKDIVVDDKNIIDLVDNVQSLSNTIDNYLKKEFATLATPDSNATQKDCDELLLKIASVNKSRKIDVIRAFIKLNISPSILYPLLLKIDSENIKQYTEKEKPVEQNVEKKKLELQTKALEYKPKYDTFLKNITLGKKIKTATTVSQRCIEDNIKRHLKNLERLELDSSYYSEQIRFIKYLYGSKESCTTALLLQHLLQEIRSKIKEALLS